MKKCFFYLHIENQKRFQVDYRYSISKIFFRISFLKIHSIDSHICDYCLDLDFE